MYDIHRSSIKEFNDLIDPFRNFGTKERLFYELYFPPPKNYWLYREYNKELITKELLELRNSDPENPMYWPIGGKRIVMHNYAQKKLYKKLCRLPAWTKGHRKIKVMAGFDKKVFPEVIKHPCNISDMPVHNYTLEDLLLEVASSGYSGHNKAVDYLNGKRWSCDKIVSNAYPDLIEDLTIL